jgi:hypothetical protein
MICRQAITVATCFDRSRIARPILAEPFGSIGYRTRHEHHTPAGAEDSRAGERVVLGLTL